MSGLHHRAARRAKRKYRARIYLERSKQHIFAQRSIPEGVTAARKSTDFIVVRERAGHDFSDRIPDPPWRQHDISYDWRAELPIGPDQQTSAPRLQRLANELARTGCLVQFRAICASDRVSFPYAAMFRNEAGTRA